MNGCLKPGYHIAGAVLADFADGVGLVEQSLYKLENGKMKSRGVESVAPILNSTAGLEPSFGGSFDSRAAAISSPSAFYTLYRQGCWLPKGANHCVYFGNVYEEVITVTMIYRYHFWQKMSGIGFRTSARWSICDCMNTE